ncbi:HNH endonuclease [Pusillimonas sp. ANT_WB101]|uniref:HNH endonuclease n=1 Tax=Pusillimonas sp. ANT_WB101 TaxID=2597356 RepID=UPI0011EEFF3F|nr:HNH endonuclease [Pusillimonas sp. ANT_WB101]KAA0892662.1 HNH endonuclease [Pusillimonas sp. ANT_WB101]
MRYWWVNQNQTYRHEVPGGYLWSPKRKANQAQNPFYDFMREVTPGDIIFSFSNTHIRAIGIAASHAYESPKPLEFGQAGAYWNNIGWRIDVKFHELRLTTRPADHMAVLAPLLPTKYAPLRPNGAGLQSVYLTRLPETLAAALIDLLGAEAHSLAKGYYLADEQPAYSASGVGLVEWEEHELNQVQTDTSLEDTERQAIVLSRRGQGLFKKRVMRLEHACRITGVNRQEHLRASHCKPWRDANNEERLDGENGLLLTPSMDHLFDRGFIGFDDNGRTIISPVAHQESLMRMGLDPQHPPNVGSFSSGQRKYLEFHRENVLLMSKYLEHG